MKTAVSVALAASTAAFELGRDDFVSYFGLILKVLGAEARRTFQMHPQGVRFFDESQRESYEKGIEKGRAQARAEAIVAFLEARGVRVTEEQRALIVAATDSSVLDRWVRQAASVASTDELFGPATGT